MKLKLKLKLKLKILIVVVVVSTYDHKGRRDGKKEDVESTKENKKVEGRKGGATEQGKEWEYNEGSVCTSTYQISSPYGTFYFYFSFYKDQSMTSRSPLGRYFLSSFSTPID